MILIISHGLCTGLMFISLDAGPEKDEKLNMGLTLVRHGLYTDLVFILYCCPTAGLEKCEQRNMGLICPRKKM